MAKEITRLYNLEDEAMLVKAQVIHDNLVNDMAAFTALFPFITAATTTALQASIDAAEALPLDSQVLTDLKVLTADVNAQLILGRQALSTLGAYAKLTYPNDEARQRVFGQDTWKAAYSDQEKMMNALEAAHAQATKAPYSTDLHAMGYTAATAANLDTIARALRTNNIMQENAKASRPVTTQDRISQYNAVWQQLQPINIASKVVFVDNPAKLDIYKLSGSSSPSTTVNITVSDTTLGNPVAEATVLLSNTSLEAALTDENGVVRFSSTTIPEIINVDITPRNGTTQSFENENVNTGTVNDFSFAIEIPE